MRVDLTKPPKVAIYCRVALADDEAIERQEKMLRVYANEQGYDNVAVYQDNGVSGIGFNRPAIKRLESHIDEGHISTVMVTELSRISRSPIEMSDWINGVRQKGIKFISVKDNITDEMFEQKAVLFQRLCEHVDRQTNQPP